MDKKQKIKELLARLDRLQGQSPAAKLAEALIKEVRDAGIQDVNNGPFPKLLEKLAKDLEDFKDFADVDGIRNSIKEADEVNTNSFIEFSTDMEDRLAEIVSRIEDTDKKGESRTKESTEPIVIQLLGYKSDFDSEKKATSDRSAAFLGELGTIRKTVSSLKKDFAPLKLASDAFQDAQIANKATKELQEVVEKLRRDVNSRIASIGNRGGSMNRSILVGGDKNTLSKFTDINLKAGAGVTITYLANQTTKYTDITISATGGGGGITRSVNAVAVNTAAGSAAGVDYVYICSAPLTLTLPPANGNTSLYTIKNTSNGTVVIAPSGADTIDNDSNLQLVVKYTSVDLISDGVANWNIT